MRKVKSVGGDDLYQILGVSRSASADDIKKSYRKLARALHPDRNPSEEGADRFKKVSAAFAVLGDAQKRKLYDEFGPDGLREGFDANAARHFKNFGGFGGMGGMGGMGGNLGGFGDLEDLLGGLFGGGRPHRPRARPQKGRDRVILARVSIEEMLTGSELNLHGAGRIKVPAGVYDGQKMRMAGKGEYGPAGPGDLLIELKPEIPKGFERSGNDLITDLPLKISEAVMGCTQDVSLPDGGSLTVKVAPGSQSGQKLRVKERGVPTKNGRGHIYLRLKILMPNRKGEILNDLVSQLDAFYE